MTSVAAIPHVTQARPSSSLVFPSDGLTPVYLDENIRKFEDKTTLKTERAYALYDANKENLDIKEIIESGRLAVLKVKNGTLQGILFYPELELISGISKFIFFTNDDKGKAGAVVIEQLAIGRLNREQYRKLATKLFNAS